MPDAVHRVSVRSGVAALLPVMLCAAAPASAETAGARLAVHAKVVPACRASTAAAGDEAAVSCTHGGRWRVSVGRREIRRSAGAGRGRSGPVRFITITY